MTSSGIWASTTLTEACRRNATGYGEIDEFLFAPVACTIQRIVQVGWGSIDCLAAGQFAGGESRTAYPTTFLRRPPLANHRRQVELVAALASDQRRRFFVD
jgi:hypothetical protein